nr:hypothetical protein Iba_chr09bCG7540 [Ipomoea batatas]
MKHQEVSTHMVAMDGRIPMFASLKAALLVCSRSEKGLGPLLEQLGISSVSSTYSRSVDSLFIVPSICTKYASNSISSSSTWRCCLLLELPLPWLSRPGEFALSGGIRFRVLIFEVNLSNAGYASSSSVLASLSKQLQAVSRQASRPTNSNGRSFFAPSLFSPSDEKFGRKTGCDCESSREYRSLHSAL